MAIQWSLRLQLQIKTGSVATASCRQVSTIRLPSTPSTPNMV